MTLLRWLTFLLGSLILTVTVLPSWISFFVLTIVFILQWLSLHWEILICCLSFHCLCNKLKMRCLISLYSLTILMQIGALFIIIWEMLPGRISLNTLVLLLLANFVIRFRLKLFDLYIPHCKYQVKSHSSLWFSVACAATIVHRNLLFHLYRHNKSSESKVKFKQNLLNLKWSANTGLVTSTASLTSWGEVASLALVGYPSSDDITIKMPYEVDSLHWRVLDRIFSYWVG